ncbi:MAG: preprotein translocase subunit SecE [Simkania sp.]|nr:preprotein translocase subunit SecE [Simkania sp.]MCP5490805.1 preprotein translocase subunit SecE [Chlamydiales bacterium]
MKNKRKPDMSVSQKIAELSAAKKKKVKTKKTHFFQEMKEEMKKVSWTTKEELTTCTKIVIGAIFALGLSIYVVDLFIRYVLQGMGSLIRLIS